MNRLFDFLRTFVVSFVLAGILCCCGERKGPDTRGSIDITTEPSGAMVSVFDKERSKTPFHCFVPGVDYTYRFRVEKEGFEPVITLVPVKAGEKKKLHLRLKPVTSEVLIRTQPSKAKVVFDRKNLGETPLVIRDLAPGMYKAEISKSGYSSRDVTWEINSGRPVAVNVNLASNMGRFSVKSDPDNAEVVINGKIHGRTPLAADIEEGVYQVEIRKVGYAKQTFQVKIERERTVSLPLVTLGKQPGVLKITALPADAAIFVNDKPYGNAPVVLEDLTPGQYKIRAEKTGYDPSFRSVNLAPGRKMNVAMKLDSNTGTVEIVTVPPGIRIFFQGKDYGKTIPYAEDAGYSQVFRISNLQSGKHKLTLSHPRAVPNSRVVTFRLAKGETKRLDNLSLWVPNIRITRKNGSVLVGRLKAEQNDRFEFEAQQGVSYWIPKSDVSKSEKIVDQE